MINIRMTQELKEKGEYVLHSNGVSTTEAIRRFYEQLGRTQEIPVWLKSKQEDATEKKRKLLRKIAGCAPLKEEVTLQDLRDERLNKKV